MAKRLNMRKRAITIYLASDEEKSQFVTECKNLGLAVSFVAGLCFYRGIEAHIMEELGNLMPSQRISVQKPAKVVKSKRSTKRPQPKPKT